MITPAATGALVNNSFSLMLPNIFTCFLKPKEDCCFTQMSKKDTVRITVLAQHQGKSPIFRALQIVLEFAFFLAQLSGNGITS
jgi:hypothetical protein